MIKFFRNIRQNMFSKEKTNSNGLIGRAGSYMLYATGEIILVMVGILLALQVNNWNEGRKNDHRESLLVKNIIEDLRSDSVHIVKALNELENQMMVVDGLIARAIDGKKILNYDSMGLVRYSSDFRPISQRNHAEAVSILENEFTREILQTYFLKEDAVVDIFNEYETIIHNNIRPYLREAGMHNIQSLYEGQPDELVKVMLQPTVLEEQLGIVKFQQLLYERRLKTGSFRLFLNELKVDNLELIKILCGKYNY